MEWQGRAGQNGWWAEDPPGDAVLLTPVQMGPETPARRGAQSSVHSPPQQPELARDIFDLQHSQPELKQRRPPQNNEQGVPELRPGLDGIGDGRERGKRPRIGISHVRTVSDHTHKQGPKGGWTALKTADADTKQD